MQWISGTSRGAEGSLCVEAQSTDGARTLARLVDLKPDLALPAVVRRKVTLPLHDMRASSTADYLAGLGLQALDPSCQATYEIATEFGVAVIPSQLLVLATVGSCSEFRRTLLRPWGPQFLMNAIPGHGDVGLAVAPTPHRMLTTQLERAPLVTRMCWVLSYPSAGAAWSSVYANALRGTFDMRMPQATVTASIRGRMVGGRLLVTRLQLLELEAEEAAHPFTGRHAPRRFVFNETVFRRPTHGKAAEPSADGQMALNGAEFEDMTDKQWARVEPLLAGCGFDPVPGRVGRQWVHPPRSVIDVIRLKLGAPYSWSKCPGDKALKQSASVLLSKLRRSGNWEPLLKALG